MIPTPHKVSPGESVSAAHYNALLDYVLRTTPRMGHNVFFEEKPNGILISASAGAAPATVSGTPPFTVRWHEPLPLRAGEGGSPSPQWEIYMPDGCVAANAPILQIANPDARRTPGHSLDDPGWRILKVDAVLNREMPIGVHVKYPCANAEGTLPICYVWARGVNPWWNDDARLLRRAGDIAYDDVATVSIKPSEAGVVRKVYQTRRTVFEVDTPTPGTFDIEITINFRDLEMNLKKIEVVRQYIAAGFFPQIRHATEIPVETRDVWINFDTTQIPPRMSVVADPEESTDITDEHTWVNIYKLQSGRIVQDLRDVLNTVVFYR